MSYLESGLSIKSFHLNICHSGRQYSLFEDILKFIGRERPDVVLLQEVFEGSLERISNALGGQVVFSRRCRISLTDREEEAEGWGIAIGSTHQLFDIREDFYRGSREDSSGLLLNGRGQPTTASMLQAKLEVGSARFNFGTTHFTWARGAEPSDEQLQDFERLAVILDQTPDLVLSGDWNAPRGYPIFDSIAKRYNDNIPPDVETTLDTTVRPEATWKYVIDGFFTSEHYTVGNVRMVQGLSDHQGVLAEVQKAALSAI